MLKNTIAETGFAGNADITAENQTNNTIILSVTSLTPGVLTNIYLVLSAGSFKRRNLEKPGPSLSIS